MKKVQGGKREGINNGNQERHTKTRNKECQGKKKT
jgi:hypothetical protein